MEIINSFPEIEANNVK
uniref:Uncharacterized protein n=1 Tax=Rhizophora mucronata TaxID=61149 RepID=A0A2P2QHM4_RHIMU